MRRFIGICCAVVVGVAVASPGWAATLEVGPVPCGGPGERYCLISHAIPESQPGDTIHIAAGSYNDTLVINAHDLTFEGDGATTTIIDGTDKNASVVEVQLGKTATFRNLTLKNGTAPGLGGGGVLNFGTVTLEDMVISNNTAGGAGGGGILNLGTLTVLRSAVLTNHTTSASGGVYTFIGALTDIIESTIANNSSDSFAGGLYATDTATLRVRNSTISGNETNFQGGGVLIGIGAVAEFYNVTITGNVGDADGNSKGGDGGLSVSAESDAVILENTIVAGNVINAVGEAPTPSDCAGTIDSHGNNLIGGIDGVSNCAGLVASDLLTETPLLASLADNGGSTQTHALLANSPALDAGNPDGCTFDDQDAFDNPITTALTTDQRGAVRAADGTGDGTAVCDIGAMEVVCGDGRVHGNEVCDDSNTADGDTCSADCAAETDCGNGVPEGNEVCDDDNTVSGDGCSADCSEIEDLDGDGSPHDVDCNDGDNTVFPGAVESCDGTDNDCDGTTDENLGSITCGVGACVATTLNCIAGAAHSCTPTAAGTEVCADAIDNDCDGAADEVDACPVAETDTGTDTDISDEVTPESPSDDTTAPTAEDDTTAADTSGTESTDEASSAAASGCSLLVPMEAH